MGQKEGLKFNYIEKQISVDGIRITTYTFGSGKTPCLCLPGFPNSGLSYLYLIKSIEENNYNFITFDFPAWGGWSQESHNQKSYLSFYSKIILKVTEEYNLDKNVRIICYSLSTTVILNMIVQSLINPQKLVLISPYVNIKTNSRNIYSLKNLVKLPLMSVLLRIIIHFRLFRIKASLLKHMDIELFEQYQVMFNEINFSNATRMLRELLNFKQNEVSLSKIKADTLIIYGEKETLEFIESSKFLKKTIKKSNIYSHKKSHAEFFTQPVKKDVTKLLKFTYT